MPANAGLGGEIAFEHRAGIDVTFLDAAVALQKIIKLTQLRFDQRVVVIAPRIARNPAVRPAFLPVPPCQ